jgi:hypothetical protein
MKKILFFTPNFLMVPETHVMISMIQNYLDNEKNQVTILTCGGTKKFSCSLNIFGISQICKACISRRNSSISKLDGNFKILEIKKKFKFPRKFNNKKIRQLNFDGIDFGLGVYSSYANTTRDSNLRGLIANKTIIDLLNTSFSFYKYFLEHFKNNTYNKIITFNGRMSEKRPLLRYAKKNKLNISNFEKLTSERFYDFKSNLSQDRIFLKKHINNFLKKNKKNSFINENKFFKEKLHGINDPLNLKLYSKDQIKNKLPSKWLEDKKNIVFFTASDDEHLSFGKDFNPVFSSSQQSIIEKTCKLLENKKDYFFWIRVHPNWKNKKWFDQKFYKFLEKKYKNTKVIYPEENISTYAMLKRAYNVVCLWSLLLVESTYWRKKKSISVTRNDFSEMGIAKTPNSFYDYKKIIFKKFKSSNENRNLALKWAHFFLNAGIKIKYFSGRLENGYKFKNHDLGFDYKARFNFIFGRIKERLLNSYFN